MARVPRPTFVIALAFLSTTALSVARVARANGRFPQAQAIETAPGSDGSTVFLRTTFGILLSHDAGKSWRWICERALGYDGQWDPPIAVTRDGTLWVGLEGGASSTKDGCTVERHPEIGEPVKDFAVDGTGDTVVAITGRPGAPSHLWSKKPASARWERLPGKNLEDLNLLTVEIAPSKPSRIYVSGEPYDTIRGRLYRSDDDGKTFTGQANDEKAEGPFFIAAVDPKDPDRVLLRHLHGKGSELLVTRDGKTFENVLSMRSAMFGFAKSADGQTYWAASGLAKDGVFRSTDRGEHFERVSNHGVLCLHASGGARGGKLYVCENIWAPGSPFVALSTDEGVTIEPRADFDAIEGPVTCDGGEGGQALCAESWPQVHAFIEPPPDAGADAGADGGVHDAGARVGEKRTSNCGCRVAGQGADHGWLTLGLAPLMLWALARVLRGSKSSQGGRARSRQRR